MMFLKAFVVGGLICVVGQLLIDLTKLTPAKILVSFVCLGVLLGAFGVYDKLVDFAGAATQTTNRRPSGKTSSTSTRSPRSI